MHEVAICVEELSKLYRIGAKRESYRTLRESLAETVMGPFRSMRSHLSASLGAIWSQENSRPMSEADPAHTLWALKDVSFEIKRGQVVGVIGRNGAGKSTLLKILSRITEPTLGFAEIHGRVGSLLEVGTGFHPELTGRENTYLNGAILGMKKAEIDRKFDEIVAFAEVEKFIDTPVKHYSSGMYLRLAFAVAAHLEPEILIVDEVLAVGDASFQKKCLGKMDDVAKEGRTVLFVSHNMAAVAQICERVLFLENGGLRLDGEPSSVVSFYLTSGTTACASWRNPERHMGNADFCFSSAGVLSMENEPVTVIEFDEGFHLQIAYEVFCRIKSLSIVYQVLDSRGNIVWSSWDSDIRGYQNNGSFREPGRYLSTCKVPGSLLRPGRYSLSIGACTSERRLVSHDNLLSFDISMVGFRFNRNRQGIITPLLEWEVKRVS